jgi:hypothetical protein
VEDLDRQILPALAEYLHLLLLDHLPRTVVRVDDVVAKLELDVLDLARGGRLLVVLCLFGCLCRNGVLLRRDQPGGRPLLQVCR